jgi:hypothetical protein
MPIATDSGYLPDWLAALIGQGSMGANVPAGLFSDTAASPSPNVGLLSNSPLFTGVRPDAPAFQGGGVNPNARRPMLRCQDQYANVPLPPRRPNDLTSFQATAAGDPQDINTPPPGQPNANVVGTAASGAPEITAQQVSRSRLRRLPW